MMDLRNTLILESFDALPARHLGHLQWGQLSLQVLQLLCQLLLHAKLAALDLHLQEQIVSEQNYIFFLPVDNKETPKHWKKEREN